MIQQVLEVHGKGKTITSTGIATTAAETAPTETTTAITSATATTSTAATTATATVATWSTSAAGDAAAHHRVAPRFVTSCSLLVLLTIVRISGWTLTKPPRLTDTQLESRMPASA